MPNTIYKTKWKDEADTDLENIDSEIALKIYHRVESYLSQSPKELGKPLTGKYKGLYRYRYGDYRVIYEIVSENNTITITKIGHRKEVY